MVLYQICVFSALGKKVCVDDHGSVFTKAVIVNSPSTASPAHKNVKQENKLSIVSDVPTVQQTWGILIISFTPNFGSNWPITRFYFISGTKFSKSFFKNLL
jgi:hypothetical protein